MDDTGVPPAGSGHSPKGGAAISVPSPAKPSVPNAAEVADALEWLGGRTGAVALCTILEIRGFARANAQLGMQRAWDCDKPTIRVMDDWTLAIAAATGTAKTPKAVECEASQSGGKAASPNPSRQDTSPSSKDET
jgi:hypothetical protein